MAQNNLYQQLLEGLGDAIADIREKVVEEPWFGRTTSGKGHEVVAEAPPATLWQEKLREARERTEFEPSRELEREPGSDR